MSQLICEHHINNGLLEISAIISNPATLENLRRTKIGDFNIEDARKLVGFEEEKV